MATQVSLNSGAVASAGSLSIQSNGTTEAIGISTGQVATLAQNPVLTSGTANGVAYLNGSKVLTTGSALQFDGSNLGLGVTPSASFYKTFEQTGLAITGIGNQDARVYGNSYEGQYGAIYKTTGAATLYRFGGGVHYWYNAPSGTAGNYITFTQAMTLDASGNLLVGTTSRGHTGGVTSFDLDKTDGALYVNHATGTPSGYYFASFGYNTSSIGSITQNGTTGVLYNLTSDYRLKNNPTPVTGAKEFVMALQPKTWDWWDGSGKGVGFIAHEFMEVAKYSGMGEKDAVDENGKPVYQSIQPSSSEVMANLVALIQEQQTLIQQLQADVAALKG